VSRLLVQSGRVVGPDGRTLKSSLGFVMQMLQCIVIRQTTAAAAAQSGSWRSTIPDDVRDGATATRPAGPPVQTIWQDGLARSRSGVPTGRRVIGGYNPLLKPQSRSRPPGLGPWGLASPYTSSGEPLRRNRGCVTGMIAAVRWQWVI